MKQKNKKFISILAATFAIIIAAGSINAQIVSGYHTFKKATKNTLNIENATITFEDKAVINGHIYSWNKSEKHIDATNKATKEVYKKYDHDSKEFYNSYVQYMGNNTIIHESRDYETGEIYVNSYDYDTVSDVHLLGVSDELMDILELFTDAFIGNAKEYFITEEIDNSQVINTTFDKTQIPEIGNALVSFWLAESQNYLESYANDNELNDPASLYGVMKKNNIKKAYINNVVLESKIDPNGYFDYVHITAQILLQGGNGIEIPFDITVNFDITNKNTTKIQLPDIDKNASNVNSHTPVAEPEQTVDDQNNEILKRVNELLYSYLDSDIAHTAFSEKKINRLNAIIDELEDELYDLDDDDIAETPTATISDTTEEPTVASDATEEPQTLATTEEPTATSDATEEPATLDATDITAIDDIVKNIIEDSDQSDTAISSADSEESNLEADN